MREEEPGLMRGGLQKLQELNLFDDPGALVKYLYFGDYCLSRQK